MASDARELSEFYLLQPELLNEFALRQILESRCVKLPNMYTMSKEKLVELFHRVAVPLPQRKYRENRRGKLLLKMRKRQERHVKNTEPETQKSNITYGFSEASASHIHGLHGSHLQKSSHNTGDRLKPPPDAINFERKKIRLSSSSSDLENIKRLKKFDKSDSNGDVLDKIIIKDRRKEKEKEEKNAVSSQKEKSDTVKSTKRDMDKSKSHGSNSNKSESSSGSKVIKLKRPPVSTESSSSKSPSPPSSSNSEAKKRRTIKWP